MNCSTISIVRTAVTNNNSTTNGCTSGLNSNFIERNGTPNGTAIPKTMPPIINGNNTNIPNAGNITANVHQIVCNKNLPTIVNGSDISNINNNSNNKTEPNQVNNPNHNIILANTTTVAATIQNKNPELAAKIIQQSHIVCFDVDSTVIKEEGIDELANYCGKGIEVARVTRDAMGGGMTFQDALKIRLNIIRPTQSQISDFIKSHPSTLTRNVKRFIEKLKSEGKQVYLISGGFDCLIEPVANELNIPMTHVFANKLLFHYNGDYAGFDTTQPTSKSGGKAEAISLIREHYQSIKSNSINEALITMIGDGATDLEAIPPANHFIGFGGNVLRSEVFKHAQYYVTDFEQLM